MRYTRSLLKNLIIFMGIHIKSKEEIQIMREGGKILADLLSLLCNLAKPGVSTLELDIVAEKFIKDHNATPSFKGYHGFPYSLCTAINDEVVHTFPSTRKLESGQILTIDAGVFYKGFHTDSASTITIGSVPRETGEFVDKVKEVLYGAIRLVKPGVRIGDISHFIESEIKSSGYFIIKELIGHGIGHELHEEPQVPNDGYKGYGAELLAGMTICIEPIVGFSTGRIKTMSDGWNIKTVDGGLACQHEHTLLVTDSGVEILTLREEENF